MSPTAMKTATATEFSNGGLKMIGQSDKRTNDAKRIADLMRASQRVPMACCLCDRPTRSRGIFIPNKSTDFGAAPGKQRAFVYPICERHSDMTEDVHRRIEGLILGKLACGEVDGLDAKEPK